MTKKINANKAIVFFMLLLFLGLWGYGEYAKSMVKNMKDIGVNQQKTKPSQAEAQYNLQATIAIIIVPMTIPPIKRLWLEGELLCS